jgi:uncharacterized protein (TIGR02217 family)
MATNDISIVQVVGSGLSVSGALIPGLAYPIIKAPTFQTRIQRAVSGRELRALDYPAPLWQFQLGFNLLRDRWDSRAGNGVGAGYDEARALYALYSACYGAFGTFLFADPTDNQRLGQFIGVGNSSMNAFQLQATYGSGGAPSFTAPVTAVGSITVYFNGITQNPSSYSCRLGLNSSGIVTFNIPPPTGAVITADFNYYFRCRFVDDSLNFENFMYQLFSLKALKFISVFS